MEKLLLVGFLLTINHANYSQSINYKASSIDESLLKNTNSVITYVNTDVSIESDKEMIVEFRKVITVLNNLAIRI